MGHYLIVGGTRGIGAALATQLVEQGHEVTVWARNLVDLAGAQVFVNNPAESAPDLAGLPAALDGVVYCPGSINLKPFARLTQEDFLQDFQTNVLGAVRTMQAVAPLLKKSEQASVVLFSSVAASLGMPFHASIASSKAAIEGLVKSVAAEWAPNIRVNGIAPSLTNTLLAEKLLNSADKIDAAAKRHPLQKLGSPEDIAAMAAFLLSPQASWITGQILHIDGGMSALKT
ncbi:SDR family NAD(P)-dependent oxidoreductase [Cellvibrio sp. OA-2007]|uniref:SDR family NAD(P)-dependent oxidoreductase n=1 Tax=Cellvibrio sp. OA-2007 TaxID=529823 RepID=UPI0007826F74|nr:SDR family oxidoreductase [Cellvibrio sp. OA-2007]